jgi:hypothetical protein
MLKTEPQKRRTLTSLFQICDQIEKSNTTLENKKKVKELKDKYWRRDNIESVS